MEFIDVRQGDFSAYGQALDGYDTGEIVAHLQAELSCPVDCVAYEPSVARLERLPIAAQLKNRAYGGLPIQVGYVCGHNAVLNGLEFHRGCEVLVAATDLVLLLARHSDIQHGALDTACVRAFLASAGSAVMLYETTLHYAPCHIPGQPDFRAAVVLLRGTNSPKPDIVQSSEEDRMLFGRNKWLLAHPDSPEAGAGAYIGLRGANIEVK